MRWGRALSVGIGVLGALGVIEGCSSTSATTTPPAPPVDARPPAVCKPPTPAAVRFAEATQAFGLVGVGGTVVSADLDGDGWVDLVALQGFSSRGSPKDGALAGKPVRFLFLNRPDPANPGRRIFVDATAGSGLSATREGGDDRGYGIANLGDLDGDGDVDIVTCSAEPPSATVVDPCVALLNDGKAHFTLAPPSDLDKKVIWVPGAALFDYDRDGILDFWPATIAHWPYDLSIPDQPPTLYGGNGDGTFVNVSRAVGLPQKDGEAADGTEFRHMFGVTACDVDGDGDEDMLVASYGRQESQVWRNDDGKFTNVARALGLDHDDRVDYSDDQSYRCWCQGNPGKCPASVSPPSMPSFCTVFGGKYGRGWQPGVTDAPYALGGNVFTMACGDVDDDGDLDVMTATIVHGDVGSAADPTELVINDGTKFVRPGNEATGLLRPETGILWNHGDDMAVMVDLDLDGRKDLFTTTTGAYEIADHARLWHQKSDGKFEDLAVASGIVPASFKPNLHGPSFIDIDGDGDLDLVIGDTAGGPLRVYENLSAQEQNFVRVHLVGKGAGASNVSAIGARVRVTAGGRTQTQVVSGGYGHGNVQNDLVLTFGLGSACDVEAIEVRWPDAAGTVTRYEGVRANYTVELREGEPAPNYQAKK